MGSVTKLHPPRRASILTQTHQDAFHEGWSQASMVNEDAAYARGFAAAETTILGRWKRWTLLGAVIGFLSGYFL